MATTFAMGPVLQRPGFSGTTFSAAYRIVMRNGRPVYYPGGGVIDGTKSRDAAAGSTWPYLLRPGLLMGKVTATGYYAPSVIGLAGAAIASGDTTVTLPALVAAELLRRVGATGTFKVTGPALAGGQARSAVATYSALGATSATITALNANEVQQVNISPASTGGNLKLTVSNVNGNLVTTANIAWNATDATYLGSINTALDTATGVVGGIVATAIPAVDTDLGFRLTYSGAGYAGFSWPLAAVAAFPTSSTAFTTVRNITGTSGVFTNGSLIQPNDGSETILTFIPDGIGLLIDDVAPVDINFPEIPVGCSLGSVVTASQLLPWPADTGSRAYIKAALKATGNFVFDDY